MTTVSRNYRQPREIRQDVPDLAHWAHSRETHIAVACAIHAVADTRRSAEIIWEEPTDAEYDHVRMAVSEYITSGDFDADDTFSWGMETLQLSA